MSEEQKQTESTVEEKNPSVTHLPGYAQDAAAIIWSAIERLETPGAAQVASRAFADMIQSKAPAAKKFHHCYPYGLLVHTAEVLDYSTRLSDTETVALAAILHDWAKVYEYKFDLGEGGVYKMENDRYVISDLPYRKNVGHVSGSVVLFIGAALEYRMTADLVQNVVHCMLAHHGRLEWGSPVTPQTPEAWALHLGDMFSAHAGAKRNGEWD